MTCAALGAACYIFGAPLLRAVVGRILCVVIPRPVMHQSRLIRLSARVAVLGRLRHRPRELVAPGIEALRLRAGVEVIAQRHDTAQAIAVEVIRLPEGIGRGDGQADQRIVAGRALGIQRIGFTPGAVLRPDVAAVVVVIVAGARRGLAHPAITVVIAVTLGDGA